MTPDEYRAALTENSNYGAWLRYVSACGIIPSQGFGFEFLTPDHELRPIAQEVLGPDVEIPVIDPFEEREGEDSLVGFARRVNDVIKKRSEDKGDRA